MDSLNTKILQAVCQHFQIGKLIQPPIPILGSKVNQVWKLITSIGIYVLKRVYAHARYEETEYIASAYKQQGLPVIPAYRVDQSVIFSENGSCFLLFDWIDAQKINPAQVTLEHAKQVGQLLAHMHAASLPATVHKLTHLDNRFYNSEQTEKAWLQRVEEASRSAIVCQSALQTHLTDIITTTHKASEARKKMASHAIPVITHRDLTPNNILWQNHQPIIIDWELAGLMHPAVELISAACDWSILTPHHINHHQYRAVFLAYQEAGGGTHWGHWPEAWLIMMSAWLSWLYYNLTRFISAHHLSEKQQAEQEVVHTLLTFAYLNPHKAVYLSMIP